MDPDKSGTDGTDPEETPRVPLTEDTFTDPLGVRDGVETGWSPPDRPWASEDWGTTGAEEAAGESLDGRLARERPERLAGPGDGPGGVSDTHGELVDDEVGDRPAGRLVDADGGRLDDTDSEMYARRAGTDGALAAAEDAAVHVVRDQD